MSQSRLDIFARKVSDEELSLEEQIEKKHREIQKQRQLIHDTKEKLEKRRERQQEEGLRIAELTVTDSLIQERIKPLRKYLKLLESKFQHLKKQRAKVQKDSSSQSDLFN